MEKKTKRNNIKLSENRSEKILSSISHNEPH